MSAWTVTVRTGPKVERVPATTLEQALDVLETETRAAATTTRLGTVDLRFRRFAPADQVATRAELRGPGRWRPAVRAGIDVRGDGEVEAWIGRVHRAVVAPERGETPYDALRRELQSTSVEP